MTIPDEQLFPWITEHMRRTARALSELPSLAGTRFACSMHLDEKMLPFILGLRERGAEVFLTTCNADTVRPRVVEEAVRAGCEAAVPQGLSQAEVPETALSAVRWGPTHFCEMGGELSTALVRSESETPGAPIASMEATGSGVARIRELSPSYPVWNWDDVPIKEGLHNRYMVGLTCWHSFFECTRLTLHERRVLVVGFGLVGRGVAEAARSYGGTVVVAERDPGRLLEARYSGYDTDNLSVALPEADVVVTATGAPAVIGQRELSLARSGAFLVNVGHRADEIDLSSAINAERRSVLPHVEKISWPDRYLYFVAGGSMINLTAGHGDSLNSFDTTLALMTRVLGHMVRIGTEAGAGLNAVPDAVWQSAF